METLAIIISLICLVVSLCILAVLIYVLYKIINLDVPLLPNNPFVTKEEPKEEKDAYTPDYAEENEDLSDFEPDFDKPLKVIVKDKKGNKTEYTTSEGEELNPIETDDIFTEEEDENK